MDSRDLFTDLRLRQQDALNSVNSGLNGLVLDELLLSSKSKLYTENEGIPYSFNDEQFYISMEAQCSTTF